MNKTFILLLMIFLHIIDDFNLQGIMASMKQKEWWKSQSEYTKLYKFDWLPALFMHSFSWTFMIMAPIAFYFHFQINKVFIILFIFNIFIHGFVDHLKANKKRINLIADQCIHMIQILDTFAILIIGNFGS